MQSTRRLATTDNFKFLFSRGRRIESPLFRVVWLKNNLPLSRFAFVTSRAVSKRAVIRNRLRRRAKEWYGKQTEFFSAPVDIAVIFKKEAAGATRAEFYAELKRATTQLL